MGYRRSIFSVFAIFSLGLASTNVSADPVSGPGVEGWSTPYGSPKSTAWAACDYTADQHMGTDLVDIDLSLATRTQTRFDCIYPSFIAAGGVQAFATTWLECKPGYFADNRQCVKIRTEPRGPSCPINLAESDATESANEQPNGSQSESVLNPVLIATGEKYEAATDYVVRGARDLTITRTYRSRFGRGIRGSHGFGWTSKYDIDLKLIGTFTSTDRPSEIIFVDGEGSAYSFFYGSGLSWGSPAGSSAELNALNSNWRDYELTLADGRVLQFVKFGSKTRLERITWPDGYFIQYHRIGESSRIKRIVDSLGQWLEFKWTDDVVTEIEASDGAKVAYTYLLTVPFNGLQVGGTERLETATLTPAGGGVTTTTTYHYENADDPLLLTGITDARGVRYATFAYDAFGRVTTSKHFGDADEATITYDDVNNTRTVTNALGKQTIYHHTLMNGFLALTEVEGVASTSCAASNSTYAYDANGYRSQMEDAEGNITDYTTNSRGLQTNRTEAAGTAVERDIDTQWHAELALPTQIDRGQSTIDFAYNAAGLLTSRTETDTTSHSIPYSSNGQTRTWAYQYSSIGGGGGPATAQSITITNPSAETGDLTGWTVDSGSPAAISPAMISGSGSYAFTMEGGGNGKMHVDASLPAAASDQIDAGNGVVSIKWRQRGSEPVTNTARTLFDHSSGTFSASGSHSNHPVSYISDGDDATHWVAKKYKITNQYVRFSNPTAFTISGMRLRSPDVSHVGAPSIFNIQKSTDGGSTWTTVFAEYGLERWNINGLSLDFYFGADHTAADWRVYVYYTAGNHQYLGIAEWDFITDSASSVGDPLANADLGWAEIKFLDGSSQAIGSSIASPTSGLGQKLWKEMVLHAPAPSGARSAEISFHCTVQTSPGCNVEFDNLEVDYLPTNIAFDLTLDNRSFETDDFQGWTVTDPGMKINKSTVASDGTRYVYGNNNVASYAFEQIVDLPATIGSGSVILSWDQQAYYSSLPSDGDGSITFLDSGGVAIGSTVNAGPTNFEDWTSRSIEADVPAGAVAAKLEFNCTRVSGTYCDVYFDNVALKAYPVIKSLPPQLTSIDGPLAGTGDTVSFEYDADGFLSAVENELGHRTEVITVNDVGQPTQIEDANNILTDITYDGERRVASITVNPGAGGATTSFTYDEIGQITRVTLPDATYLDYTYDGARRLTEIENSAGEKQVFTHDDLGNVLTSTTKAGGGATVASQSFVYDELGRTLKSIGAYSQETVYGYDRNDQMTSLTDPRGEVFSYGFDALNRLIQETDPDLGETDIALREDDALTGVTDAENLDTTYVRNGFGEVIRRDSPDSGVTDYVYDGRGLVTQMTDGRGVITNYAYDDAGRLTSETYPATPSQNLTYAYDSTTGGNKGVGRLTSVTDPEGSTSFVYDARGNVTKETRVTSAQSYAADYVYDAADKPTSITYPSGRVVELSYDAAGRVSAIDTRETSASAAVSVLSGVTYFPMSQAGTGAGDGGAMWSLDGATFGNGLVLSFGHDLDGRLTDIDLAPTVGSAVQDLSFTYDLAGNITAITDGVAAARSQTFTYDSLSRLTQADGLYGTIDYTYDLVGNRTSRVVDDNGSVGTETYAYGAGTHRLASMTRTGAGATTRTMSYAASGQLDAETRGGVSYSYDIDNAGRLAEALQGLTSLAAYGYDAFEQRILKSTASATTHFVYDLAGRLIAEHDGTTGDALREYIYLGLMPVGFIDHSGMSPALYFVHTDQVMNPRKMTDSAAVTVWDRVATPFGEEYFAGGSLTQPLRFPGQVDDNETNLFQNWHREYDPSLGRYVQSDPIGLMGGINTYAYVAGNPLTRVDPTGEFLILAAPFACAGGGCQAAAAGAIALAAAATAVMMTPQGQESMQNAGTAAYAAYCGRCEPLYAEINQLTNELKKRQGDLFEDRMSLPPTGPMSIAGHQQQFNDKQRRLRRKLLQAAAQGCNRVNPDAWKMATKGTPSPR